jgi:hypothetical protein
MSIAGKRWLLAAMERRKLARTRTNTSLIPKPTQPTRSRELASRMIGFAHVDVRTGFLVRLDFREVAVAKPLMSLVLLMLSPTLHSQKNTEHYSWDIVPII